MKWNLNSSSYLKMMYYWAKFVGLAPFTLKDDICYPGTVADILYLLSLAATVLVIVGYLLIMNPEADHDEPSFVVFKHYTKLIDRIFSHTALFITLIVVGVMHKKILYLLNELRHINSQFKSFGMEENQGKYFEKLFVTAVVTNVIITTVNGYKIYMTPTPSIVLDISFISKNWINFNLIFIFCQILLFIRRHFILINEELWKVCGSTRSIRCRSSARLRRSTLIQLYYNLRDENQGDNVDFTGLQQIRKIEGLHLNLCSLLEMSTEVFGVPVLLCIFQYFCILVFHSYWTYLNSVNSDMPNFQDYSKPMYVIMVGDIIRILYATANLLFIAYATSTTCEQGNATKVMLSKVWSKAKRHEWKDEFTMFSIQLLQNPTTIRIFGFFDLDYSLMYKILCAALAHLIFMITFGSAN